MNFERFIAKRYLISKHKINFITIISFISIFGITIGVAALIVVLSVFNGFSSLVTSFLVNFDPHLRIEIIDEKGFETKNKILSLLENEKEVVSYTPFINNKALALQGNYNRVVNLKGIDPLKGKNVYGLETELLLNNNGIPKVLIGIQLADKLQAIIGDTVTLVSPAGIERAITQFALPKYQKFLVAGVFRSNNNEYDSYYIFTDFETTQNLFQLNDKLQGYELRLKSINNSEKFKNKIINEIGSEHFAVSTWYDFHRDLYSVMQIERWAAYIILSLIIAVASFNILGSLTMSVIEKKRDIGILQSLGATNNSILKIFMFEGLLIGIIGTITGLILGYLICYLQIKYNIYALDPLQYKINSLPVELRLQDFFTVGGAALFLSLLASYFPAKKAASTDLLEAIKWE